MTYKEWIDQAEEYERKASEAYEAGDEVLGEMYEVKAQASRACADYATDQ